MPKDTVPYLGTTEKSLRALSAVQRLVGLADQRRLFKHQGVLRLQADTMVLEDWCTVPRSEIIDVALTFTPTYSRFTAGGSRGAFPSAGFIGEWGKPIVVTLRTSKRIYLLLDYSWWSGIARSKEWYPLIAQWAAVEH